MKQFDRDELKAFLKTFNQQQLLCFTLLCTERLEIAYWAFSMREHRHHEMNVFADTLQWAWGNLSGSCASSEAAREYNTLKKTVHHSDEFGDPLAVQAQCAVIGLLYTIEAQIACDLDAAAWCALKVIEALDNFVQFSAELAEYELDENFDNFLLKRELEKQLEDIRLLRAMTSISQLNLPLLRTRNRLLSIPPAQATNSLTAD